VFFSDLLHPTLVTERSPAFDRLTQCFDFL